MINNLHYSKLVQNPAWQTLVPVHNAPDENSQTRPPWNSLEYVYATSPQ